MVKRTFQEWWIYAALAAATLAVYAQAVRFDFVNYDDPDYVTASAHVRQGLTPDGIEWAFTSGEAANWFPLTRVSHLLDVQLFGLHSGWHHFTNIALHALASMLLFAFLRRATGARWPSAFVAFVFALHPLHVESVAWVSERKDVLCAVFWFLTLWAYVRFTEAPDVRRYLLVVAAFCLGAMSKPMIVTLPFLLWLLDWWPLRRWQARPAVIVEKIPLLAISAALAAVTYWVQSASGAVKEIANLPLATRIENALESYVVYLTQTVVPARLSAFYPYPAHIEAWQPLAAGVLLAAISAAAFLVRRKYPYVLVGWFWFVGTLVPVIGLVQVGTQAHADRYMYVPMVGLAIVAAWAARGLPMPVAAAVCTALAAVAWVQTGYWENSETLFRHAIAVTDDNYIAEHNLGSYLMESGRASDAVAPLNAALRIRPDSAQTHTDLGSALAKLGRWPEAVAEFETAVQQMPDSAIPHNNLANALTHIPGRMQDAITEYRTALRIDPQYQDARANLAAVQSDPAETENNVGVSMVTVPGRKAEAMEHFRAAIRMKPDYADAHYNLGVALSEEPGKTAEAIAELEKAEKLRPDPNLERAIRQLKGK